MGSRLETLGPARGGGGQVILRTWRARHWRTGPGRALALEDLYRELAAHHAGAARAALARERDRTRLFAQSAAALEEAAGVLHHTAAICAPGADRAGRALDEHAAGLEAAAARFELAADITRARRAR